MGARRGKYRHTDPLPGCPGAYNFFDRPLIRPRHAACRLRGPRPGIVWVYASCSGLRRPPAAMPDPAADVSPTDFPAARAAKRPSKTAMPRLVLGLVLGVAIGLAGTLLVLRWKHRDPTPDLTPKLFYAAHERWKVAAPTDYDIEVRVTGSQPAVYRVEVRGGQPQTAL